MLMRHASLACLALLVACGGNESDKTSSEPTASAKTAEAPPPIKPPSPTPPPPVVSEPAPVPKAPGLGVLPPDDTSPGIVHEPATEDEGLLLDAPETAFIQRRAVAYLSPASGTAASGTVTFVAQATGVEVRVQLEGLSPGKHGLHIHETGDCSASDAGSAGEHWNPTGSPHGGPDSPARHVGDLGNVEADAAGHVDTTFLDHLLSLADAGSIVGHAVVVHADPDDLITQPAGNSGARVACGVIEVQPAPSAAAGGG